MIKENAERLGRESGSRYGTWWYLKTNTCLMRGSAAGFVLGQVGHVWRTQGYPESRVKETRAGLQGARRGSGPLGLLSYLNEI